ncbi:unnamed protein product [Brachionus calyciflorus]|uniref:Uncharacterized protein n=1 Tax=Brachionus calyciflorus TaxID=104777 RepID=A0A813RYN1_9BILA|nr:unnamed protein product [Brachionus calyciflorus]
MIVLDIHKFEPKKKYVEELVDTDESDEESDEGDGSDNTDSDEVVDPLLRIGRTLEIVEDVVTQKDKKRDM